MTDHPLEVLPPHPELQVMTWSELERETIRAWGAGLVARERERCAVLCETAPMLDINDSGQMTAYRWARQHAAEAIRKGP